MATSNPGNIGRVTHRRTRSNGNVVVMTEECAFCGEDLSGGGQLCDHLLSCPQADREVRRA